MRRALIVLAGAALLAGCGNDKTDPPDLGRIATPTAFKAARFDQAGIELKVPVNWSGEPADSPQIAILYSGDARVGVWRYPRSEPLPETRAQLSSARNELVKSERARDATFQVDRTRVIVKKGLKAVEIIGTGTNQGERRKIHSLHAYSGKAEIVVDAYAPVEAFAKVDKDAFGPMARSLRVTKPDS